MGEHAEYQTNGQLAAVIDNDRGPYITTFSLKKFYPKDPRPQDIDIYDIAHALCFQCRWSGHTSHFYSVGRHSLIIAREALKRYGPTMAMCGLLHDASEAYIVDIPRPIKHTVAMDGYREMEARVEGAILEKYGLVPEIPKEILQLDDLLLVTEARYLMGYPEWSVGRPYLPFIHKDDLLEPATDLDFIREFDKLRSARREMKI